MSGHVFVPLVQCVLLVMFIYLFISYQAEYTVGVVGVVEIVEREGIVKLLEPSTNKLSPSSPLQQSL